MRQRVVAGNWKMHGDRASIARLLSELKQGIQNVPDVCTIVFPSYPYIPMVADSLSKTKIHWGAQNVHTDGHGAYTGEVCADMLTDFGCTYVIVGHSERRHIFGESNEYVALKVAKSRSAGLIPILCVGETKEQHQREQTISVISEQIQAVLNLKQGINLFENVIIAYEPVWAIGTGLTATAEYAQKIHLAIRQLLAEHNQTIAKNVAILYGGSVKAENAAGLFAMPDIDGALVGGASLKGDSFLQIIAAAQNL